MSDEGIETDEDDFDLSGHIAHMLDDDVFVSETETDSHSEEQDK